MPAVPAGPLRSAVIRTCAPRRGKPLLVGRRGRGGARDLRPSRVSRRGTRMNVAATAWVWWAKLVNASSGLFRYLDVDERRRFSTYRRNDDRDRFLVGCALAKVVVANATGAKPEEIRFDRTCPSCAQPHGKPRLANDDVAFSVSHSGDLVGVALSSHGPVGLDVECATEAAVVPAALTPGEAAALAEATDPGRDFLVFWTRKEAALKALGAGLRLEPRDVVVSLPAEPPRLIAWPAPLPPERVALADLVARPNHVASLAVIGRCDHVVERDGAPLLSAAPRWTRG